MHITFAPRGILQIDDARIVYRNFSGIGSKFNREGDRNFAVVIPDRNLDEVELRELGYGRDEEIALVDVLINEGWNVKIKPPRDEDDSPFMYIPVKIKFNDRGPGVYLKSDRKMIRLSEETIDCLDNIDIMSVDLDIRPYDWDVNGKNGRTAYLQSIHVTQEVDRFAARYAEEEYPWAE